MDSVPATMPSITATPGDPELLGPLSVLYAAFIAKLLEVTVPIPREGLKLSQAGGRVLSRVGALIVQRRNGVCQIRGKQDVSMLFREADGSVFEKICPLFFILFYFFCVLTKLQHFMFWCEVTIKTQRAYRSFPHNPRLCWGMGPV